MRILVTQQGSNVLQELGEMASTFNTINRDNHQRGVKRRRLTMTKINQYHSNSPIKTEARNSKHHLHHNSSPYIKPSKLSRNKEPQTIKLSMSKLVFPSKIREQYENNYTTTKSIITSNELLYPTMTIGSDQGTLLNDTRLFSLNDIIPEKTITNMKKEFIHNERNKEKMTIVNEKNFRTIYHSNTPLQKFNEMLSYPKIDKSRINLIRYLNEKKTLSPMNLRTLIESDKDKVGKVNKMCQAYAQKESQLNMVNVIIQKKLKQKTNSLKTGFVNGIGKMKREMTEINTCLKKYDNRLSDKENYKDLHYDIVKNYWKKHDYERYNKRQPNKHAKSLTRIISNPITYNHNWLNQN